MSAPVGTGPTESEVRVVEDLVRAMGKGQRALQMYLSNNPVYRRTLEQMAEAFAPVWAETGHLVLEIRENDITWEGMPVTGGGSAGHSDSLAAQLYQDGLRRLSILPGAEHDEIIRFLEVVNRAKLLAQDASDDLLTLLWEQEFVLISYAFIEVLGEGIEFLQESRTRDADAAPGTAEAEVAEQGAPGGAEFDDADSTPYFLDEAEVRFIRSEIEDEYRRDIRGAAIDALLDVLEIVDDAQVRREVVGLLEEVLPTQLASGGFGAVAHILRELRVIVARVPGLDEQLHAQVLSFEERLSEPEILEQLFRALDDGAARGKNEEVGAVLRELKPSALPAILTHLGRSLDPTVRQVLGASIDDLARGNPELIGGILEDGPPEAIEPALDVVARLRMQQLLPKVVRHFREGDPVIRHAAVRSLAQLGTPTAIDALEDGLNDADRAVRQATLAAVLARGGSGGARERLEALLFKPNDIELERSERRGLFEAYAQVGGSETMPRLQDLLEPKGLFRRKAPAELRACAIYALARLRTFEARMLVDRFTSDKEPVVRSAANTVLRDWKP
jgi:HEAT repeat protein